MKYEKMQLGDLTFFLDERKSEIGFLDANNCLHFLEDSLPMERKNLIAQLKEEGITVSSIENWKKNLNYWT